MHDDTDGKVLKGKQIKRPYVVVVKLNGVWSREIGPYRCHWYARIIAFFAPACHHETASVCTIVQCWSRSKNEK